MSSSGLLVVLSGPSGVGKSTVARRLLERPGYRRSISVTTRAPRAGEVPGRDYEFTDTATFRAWRAEGRFLESAEVHGNLYGTRIAPVKEAIERGEVILLVIDVQGGAAVREATTLPTLLLFVAPPSFAVLEKRLRKRATENEKALTLRLLNARRELAAGESYDHTVVNDELDATVAALARLIEDARHGRHPARSHR